MKVNVVEEAIITALVELMIQKEYDNISVTDIVKRAGVSRVTYYRHFQDKKEILEKCFEFMEESFLKEYRAELETADYDKLIILSLETFRDKRKTFKALKKANMEYLYLDYLTKEMQTLQSRARNKYTCDFIAGAFYNVTMIWLDNDCQDPVNVVAETFQMVQKALRFPSSGR